VVALGRSEKHVARLVLFLASDASGHVSREANPDRRRAVAASGVPPSAVNVSAPKEMAVGFNPAEVRKGAAMN